MAEIAAIGFALALLNGILSTPEAFYTRTRQFVESEKKVQWLRLNLWACRGKLRKLHDTWTREGKPYRRWYYQKFWGLDGYSALSEMMGLISVDMENLHHRVSGKTHGRTSQKAAAGSDKCDVERNILDRLKFVFITGKSMQEAIMRLKENIERLQTLTEELFATRHGKSTSTDTRTLVENTGAKLHAMTRIQTTMKNAFDVFDQRNGVNDTLYLVLGKPHLQDLEDIEDLNEPIMYFGFARSEGFSDMKALFVPLHSSRTFKEPKHLQKASWLGSPFLETTENPHLGKQINQPRSWIPPRKARAALDLAQTLPFIFHTKWVSYICAKRLESRYGDAGKIHLLSTHQNCYQCWFCDVLMLYAYQYRPFLVLAVAIAELAGFRGHWSWSFLEPAKTAALSRLQRDIIRDVERKACSEGAYSSALKQCFILDALGRSDLTQLEHLRQYRLKVIERLEDLVKAEEEIENLQRQFDEQ